MLKKIFWIAVILVISIGGCFVQQKFFQILPEQSRDETKSDENIFADENEQKNDETEKISPNESEEESARVRRAAVENEEIVTAKLNEIIYNTKTDNYERTIFENISEYEIAEKGDFDFVEVPTDEYEYDELAAGSAGLILPTKRFEIHLPGGAIIENVEIIAKNPVALGELNIPQGNPCPDLVGSDCEEYLVAPDSIGLFDEMYSYFTYDAQDEVSLNIDLFPVTYDTATDEVTLFKNIELKIEYKTEIKGALLQASPTGQHYASGEMVDVFVSLENVIDQPVDFDVTVEMRGQLEKVVQTKTQIMTVDSGEFSQANIQFAAPEVDTEYESFWMVTSVSDGENEIGTAREHINVSPATIVN